MRIQRTRPSGKAKRRRAEKGPPPEREVVLWSLSPVPLNSTVKFSAQQALPWSVLNPFVQAYQVIPISSPMSRLPRVSVPLGITGALASAPRNTEASSGRQVDRQTTCLLNTFSPAIFSDFNTKPESQSNLSRQPAYIKQRLLPLLYCF